MISYLMRMKEKFDRQIGPDVLRRIWTHQGLPGFSNLMRVSMAALREQHPARADYLPPCLFIEITNRCNLTCNTCPLGTPSLAYKGYQKADISFEQAKQVIDQIPSLFYVVIQGIGEPLLNMDLEKIIQHCTNKGISTYFNSNGTALTEKRSQGIIDAGLTNLSISVNSVDEEVFASTRAGASIKKILENVRRFIELRRKAGAKRPLLSFRAILMRETEPSMEELVFASEKIGIDVLYIQLYSSLVADRADSASCLTPTEIDRFLSKLNAWRKKVSLEIITEAFGDSSNNLGQCHLPWFSPMVTAEGYVTPCCSIYNPSVLNMGNVFKTPFDQIWNSKEFVQFRENFYRRQPVECRGCPNYKIAKTSA